MINAILAFNRPLGTRTVGGQTLKPDRWLRLDYGGDWVRTTWREPEIANSQRSVFDVQLSGDDVLQQIEADFPDMIVIGSWERDTGQQVRGIHAKALEIMPDDVERDEDGNEIGRTRPSTLRDYHRWAGQAERDWA